MKSLWVLMFWLLLVRSSATGAANYDIFLNTSSLMGHQAAPFSIDAQFNGGDVLNNTAIFSNFQFGGGSAVGAPGLVGGASGNLTSGFTLSGTSFRSEFIQSFVPGTKLTFTFQFTTHKVASGFPSQISIAILDGSGAEVPTLGLNSVGSDLILLTNIDSDNPSLQLFATDSSRAPVGGGPPINMDAPIIVPEPLGSILVGTGLIALALLTRRRPRE